MLKQALRIAVSGVHRMFGQPLTTFVGVPFAFTAEVFLSEVIKFILV